MPSEAELRERFAAPLRLTSTDVVKDIQQRLRAKAGGRLARVELHLPTLHGTP